MECHKLFKTFLPVRFHVEVIEHVEEHWRLCHGKIHPEHGIVALTDEYNEAVDGVNDKLRSLQYGNVLFPP